MSNEQLFVPTRHHHSGIEEEIYSHWDHKVHSYNTNRKYGNCKLENDQIFLKSDKIGSFDIDFTQIQTINKYTITGMQRNRDLYFDLVPRI